MRLLIVSAALLLSCRYCDAAYVYSLRGEVDLKKAGSSEWTRLDGEQDKTPLKPGDEMRTARASTVEIYMDDGSRIKLAPLSAFKMSAEDKESVSLGLYFGRVRSWVKKFSRKFEVRTP